MPESSNRGNLMLPIAILMIEHRLIERIIEVLKNEIDRMDASNHPDVVLIDSLVDSIRTYADRTHHGKEEEILFHDLRRKKLPEEYQHTMDDLIMEHIFARKETLALVEAKTRYLKGDIGALGEMAQHMRTLVAFYPKHIWKEDQHFFLPAMDHFNDMEREAMLREFQEFDSRLIHEKYHRLTRRFELERGLPGANTKSEWIGRLYASDRSLSSAPQETDINFIPPSPTIRAPP